MQLLFIYAKALKGAVEKRNNELKHQNIRKGRASVREQAEHFFYSRGVSNPLLWGYLPILNAN